ncbi:hypothetical protein AB1Y20_018462 [Prymnesium parvum]|uniref:Spore protein YkvP/CgeB glycosyl transferase-like domain-containing protein n=1 Tax=Prymnesium parvum TaxID=97485 RepID=A0AB34JSG2_PRYPA
MLSAPLSPSVLWLEQRHGGLEYYDALRHALALHGAAVFELQLGRDPSPLHAALETADAVLLGFGWMSGEAPSSREVRALPEFGWNCSDARPLQHPLQPHASTRAYASAHASTHPPHARCWCGRVPLLVLLNKEYTLMQQKMHWLRAHCVTAAFTVHHDVASYEAATGVPFYRISFGADVARFSGGRAPTDRVGMVHRIRTSSGKTDQGMEGQLPASEPIGNDVYDFDLGFTGVVRKEQTDNWRYRIWKQSWPKLQARGVRLYSGERGGVHVGVAHAELNSSEYVRRMRSCKAWLSTTGPADLVGTRFFEVMATGTTLLIANRLSSNAAYSSLGIVEGKHALMFSTLPEFEEAVLNLTRPSFENRRRSIIAHAQHLAFHHFSWTHVASRIVEQISCVTRSLNDSSCHEPASERHRYRVGHPFFFSPPQ